VLLPRHYIEPPIGFILHTPHESSSELLFHFAEEEKREVSLGRVIGQVSPTA
jgi:hypothetical protein